MWLDWPKLAKQFSVDSDIKFLCQYQASKHLASSFPFSDFYILSSLLSSYFSGISCTLNFFFCTTTTFCFKRYSQCKIWKKKPIGNACFFTFFTTLGLIWPKLPQDLTHFDFFGGFQWNMLGDYIILLLLLLQLILITLIGIQ